MQIAVLVFFFAIPVVACFFGWQGWKLFHGKPALLDKRLVDRAIEETRHIKRFFGWFSLSISLLLFGLFAASLLIPLSFDIWRNFLGIIFSTAVIWVWMLQRRFGLHDAR